MYMVVLDLVAIDIRYFLIDRLCEYYKQYKN